jgi:hypothetical protein
VDMPVPVCNPKLQARKKGSISINHHAHPTLAQQVVITAPQSGAYSLHVRAVYVFAGARPQRYSLVVLGDFEGTLQSDHNPALKNATHARPQQ